MTKRKQHSPHQPFRVVLGLYVTPDFSDVMAGKCEPPWVDHSKVDFGALAATLAELFQYGPPVTIRVPNDSIDQVTIQGRWGQIPGQPKHSGDLRCTDFGDALLACAGRQSGTVIEVRDAWRPLHSLKDRALAPPPSLLPFVIEAEDFEDAMIWSASAKVALGLPFLSPDMVQTRGDISADTEEGTLPVPYRKKLGKLFGCKFEEFSLLDRLAMDYSPIVAGLTRATKG